MAFLAQAIVVGDTIAFTARLKKDGAVWDVSGATVTFYLQDPDGVVTAYSGTVTDGPNGVVDYVTAVGDLDAEGDWLRQWKVVKSSIVLKSEEIPFEVLPALA